MQKSYWKFLFCNIDTFSRRLWVFRSGRGTCICLPIEVFFHQCDVLDSILRILICYF